MMFDWLKSIKRNQRVNKIRTSRRQRERGSDLAVVAQLLENRELLSAVNGAGPLTLELQNAPSAAPVVSVTQDAAGRPIINWNAVDGATSFDVFAYDVVLGREVFNARGVAATTYTSVLGLPAGRYSIYVRGNNLAGSGPFGVTEVILSGGTSQISPPTSAPNLSAAKAGSARPTINWQSVPNATAYEVLAYDVDAGREIINRRITGTSFTPTFDLAAGRYVLYVRGVNSVGNGPYSSISLSVNSDPTATSPPPTAPQSLTANNSSSRPTISWQPVQGATSYEVLAYDVAAGSEIINMKGIAGTSFTPQFDLKAGRYEFYVRATNSAGSGPYGSFSLDVSSGSTTPKPTAAPQSLTLSGTSSKPTITWQAIPNATSYEVLAYDTTAGREVINVNGIIGTSFTAPSNLSNGRYTFYVRGVNGAGNGQFATLNVNVSGGTASTPPPTGAPQSLSSSGSNSRPTITWQAVPNAATYDVLAYDVAAGREVINATGVTGTSYTPPADLSAGKYTFYVRGTNNAGSGQYATVSVNVSSTPQSTIQSFAELIAAINQGTLTANSLTNDQLFDILGTEIAGEITTLSGRAADLAKTADGLPIIGDDIASKLTPEIEDALRLEAPTAGLRNYLQQRGFRVDHIVTVSELLSGNYTDLIVLTYDRTVTPSSAISVQGDGEIGNPGGISIDVNGILSAQATLEFDVTFGIHRTKGAFIQEGSTVTITLDVDGAVTGAANIPNLTQVDASATAPAGKHLVDAGIDFVFSDFDSIADERAYFDGTGGFLLDAAFNNPKAVDLTATVDLQATLSVDNPLNQLPDFLRNFVVGAVPDSLDWGATVHYDIVTGDFEYAIDGNSLTSFVDAFQQTGNFEDAVFELLIDQIAANNPIPESVQTLFGTKLPLLEQNLLDLLGVPEAAQFLIAPEAFRGKSLSEVESLEDGNRLDFNLDFFSPQNLINFLSGEHYDIFSVDIDQKFEKEIASITVLPETTLFSYLGLINVTAQVDLIPDLYFRFDLVAGLDSNGFYVEGAAKSQVATSDPHIEFGGGITGRVIAEGDVLVVLDLIRVTVDVGLHATGGFTLISPVENDLRVRGKQIINPDNIHVTAGIDLNLDFKGEVGFLDLGIKGQVEEKLDPIELYRHKGGTLSDIQDKLESFKEKLDDEGREAILVAAQSGKPQIVAAAAYILYEETQDYRETVRRLIQTYNVKVVDAAKALVDGANAGLANTADAIFNTTKDLGETAHALYEGATRDLGEIAKALYDGVTTQHAEILDAIADGILQGFAQGIHDKLTEIASPDAFGQQVDDLNALVAGYSQDLQQLIDSIIPDLQSNQQRLESELIDLRDQLAQQLFDHADSVVATANKTIEDLHRKYTESRARSFKALVTFVRNSIEQARAVRDTAIRTADQAIEDLENAIEESERQIDDAVEEFEAEKSRIDAWVADTINRLPYPLNRLASKLDSIRREGEKLINKARDLRDRRIREAVSSIGAARREIEDRRDDITAAGDLFVDEVQTLNEQIVNFDWNIDEFDYSFGDFLENGINTFGRDVFDREVRSAIQQNPDRNWREWFADTLRDLYRQQGDIASEQRIQGDLAILDYQGWLAPLESLTAEFRKQANGITGFADAISYSLDDTAFAGALTTISGFLSDLGTGQATTVPQAVNDALTLVERTAGFLKAGEIPDLSRIDPPAGIGGVVGSNILESLADSIGEFRNRLSDVVSVTSLLTAPIPSAAAITNSLRAALVFTGPGTLDVSRLGDAIAQPGRDLIQQTRDRLDDMADRFTNSADALSQWSSTSFAGTLEVALRHVGKRLAEIAESWASIATETHESVLDNPPLNR